MLVLYYFVIPLILILLVAILVQQRLIERFREKAQRIENEKQAAIELMDNIGERMTRGIDLNETLEVIAHYVVQSTRAESGAIYLLNESDQTLEARVIVGLFPPLFEDQEILASKNKYFAEKIRSHRFKVGEGLIGSVLKLEQPLLIADAEADPRVPRLASSVTPVHSLMFCALRARGKNLGVLVVVNKQGEAIFDSRDKLLLNALSDQAAITVDLVKLYDVVAKQKRLEQELQIAREFQNMLLPQALPTVDGFEFSALNQSALMVGGDFYDFFFIDRNHLGIVIADVSGKGIPGALIMAMVRSDLRAEARETFSPKEALRRVNDRLLIDTKDNVFVTITYSILDIPNRRLRFVRAGHEPTLIRHPGKESEVSVINPEGMAVGLMPTEVFENTEEVEIQLLPGDLALFYTDGAVEAINANSEEYGRKRLIEVLSRSSDVTAAQLLMELSADIQKFSRGIPQHDDITLVAFRVKAASGEEPARRTEPESHAHELVQI